VLIFGYNIKELLIDGLVLTAGVVSLNPAVVPVGVDWLAGDINLAVLHGEKGSIAAKAHLSKGFKINIYQLDNFLNSYIHLSPDGSAW